VEETMKKSLFVLSTALVLGCGTVDVQPTTTSLLENESGATPICEPYTTTLKAGQHIDAGTVTVSNNLTTLFVKVTASGDWFLNEAHLYAGLEPPTDSAPGLFPYKQTFEGENTKEANFAIPLEGLSAACDTTVYVALHTEMKRPNEDGGYQEETGWGEGTGFGTNWAMYFAYTICCEEPPPSDGCTLTLGYWKTHNEFAAEGPLKKDWPQPLDENTELCGSTWLATLQKAPKKGDVFTIVAHQYIATSLNFASGAASTPEVDEAYATAKAFVEACGKGDTKAALAAKDILDSYNNGEIGPGHCE